MTMQVEGECHCGKIAYTASVNPERVTMCHCTDCQTFAGSPYRISVPAEAGTFKLTRGEPKIYIKTAESGRKRLQGFCGDCGTSIYATGTEENPIYGLRIGALKQRDALVPKRQIWCRSEQSWAADLSGIARVETA